MNKLLLLIKMHGWPLSPIYLVDANSPQILLTSECVITTPVSRACFCLPEQGG